MKTVFLFVAGIAPSDHCQFATLVEPALRKIGFVPDFWWGDEEEYPCVLVQKRKKEFPIIRSQILEALKSTCFESIDPELVAPEPEKRTFSKRLDLLL